MNPLLVSLMSDITKLSLEDQRTLNTLLVDNIKRKVKIKGITAAAAFNIGDEVQFKCPKRGLLKIKITGFSRDGSKIKGAEIGSYVNWQVSAQMCQAI